MLNNLKLTIYKLQERGDQFQLNCCIYLASHKINGSHLYLGISNLAVSWHALLSYSKINEVWKMFLWHALGGERAFVPEEYYSLFQFPFGIRRQSCYNQCIPELSLYSLW